MGMHVSSFKCPHCDAVMGESALPNWTVLNAAAGPASVVTIFSCVKCQRVLGSTAIQTRT